MTFECIDDNKIVKAYLIQSLPRPIIDSTKFECIACKEQLIFKTEFYKQKGTVRSHFAHKKESNCSGYTPEGESTKHYSIKMNLLSDLANDKPLKIKIDNLEWTFARNEIAYIKEEKYQINERRADIIIMFNKPNFVLGNGIAIEVMVSEQQTSIDLKAIDYAQNILSVAQTTDGDTIQIVNPYPKVLKDFFENTFKQYKNEILYYEERIKLLNSPFVEKALKNNWNCLNCARATKTPEQFDKTGTTITCWKNYNKLTKKGQEKRTSFTPCEGYIPSDKSELIVNEMGVVSCSKTQKNF